MSAVDRPSKDLVLPWVVWLVCGPMGGSFRRLEISHVLRHEVYSRVAQMVTWLVLSMFFPPIPPERGENVWVACQATQIKLDS